ncbi:MAG: hypothetical protein WBY53_05420 [Acidobacteriaceae bacterium]
MGHQLGQQIESALRQSIHRIVLVLASFLPGILAFLLAVIVFALLGWGISALVRRFLTAVGFDQRLASRVVQGPSAILSDWSPNNSPTVLAARVTFWLFVLAGIAIGISAFDASYAVDSRYSIFLFPYVAHITGAILILLAGTLLARFLARSVLIGAVNAQLQYARFLSHGVKWLVLVLTAAMALDHLNIGGGVVELAFGILFGGIVLTLALAIGLGSRDLVSRSIEKTMDKTPAPRPTEVPPRSDTDTTPRLRHF